ncbi:AMP-binding protein [Nakamurella sp. YIM 132087]|uniref:AMP-binding protein n=1 Tax=Nakamurella alba TaxID=2665158 RepID=A0A7K1FGU0_9ACTN|nr:AMP-binding protein [Nakamurella alba]MTD12503.1 AMP-binding protein [Nakamurella alba]
MTVPAVARPAIDRPDSRHLFRLRLRSADDIGDLEMYRPEQLRPGNTIHACIAEAAADRPGKPAMIVVEPPDLLTPHREVSYLEVVEGIERSACLFRYAAGDAAPVVALMLPMVPEGLIATWGAQTAGIAVPLNPFLEHSALVRMLDATSATALVTDRRILEQKVPGGVPALLDRVASLREVFLLDDEDPALDLRSRWDEFADRFRDLAVDEDPLRDSMLMPTGGTTGTPKMVRMCQGHQLSIAWNVGALMGNESDGVVGHGMPNFHCGGTISLGLRALVTGQTLLTLTSVGFRSREVIEHFWEIAGRYGMTSLLATPTTAQALLAATGTPAPGHRLTDFHVGGSTVPMDLVRAFHDRFGVWLRENWGATEFHGTTTGHPNDGRQPVVGSVGRPLPHSPARVVELHPDGSWARDCAPGERGVLLIGGPSVTAGYLPESLNADFHVSGVPEPGKWGNTGDLGMIDDDGYVWVFGRAKDLIIRGGHNIDPKEIEEVLVGHPAVQFAAAIGRPDRAKGELPVAYVQLRAAAGATPEELKAFCRERVQEQAAAPVHVHVIELMPLTPVGKVSKPALRNLALEAEVRSVLDELLPGVAAEIVIDDAARRTARVRLAAGADPTGVRLVAERLGGYEFASEVSVAGAPA